MHSKSKKTLVFTCIVFEEWLDKSEQLGPEAKDRWMSCAASCRLEVSASRCQLTHTHTHKRTNTRTHASARAQTHTTRNGGIWVSMRVTPGCSSEV